MTSRTDNAIPDEDIEVVKVHNPTLTVFDSFEKSVYNGATQLCEQVAKMEWPITDPLRVEGFSFTIDKVRVHFGTVTLEIYAEQSIVNWRIASDLPRLINSTPNSALLVYVDRNDKQRRFDRTSALSRLVGQRIRYAPSVNELYLIWHPEQELGFFSLPLADGTGYLLSYGCPLIHTMGSV